MTNAKILTVDDQVDDLEIINHILKRDEYNTISARNGLEAIKALEDNNDIDIIVLDRMMPIMDGMAFLHRIKQDPKLANIPVIMQTAAGDEHEIQEGIDAGVYWYITKPFSHNLLSSIIKSALRVSRKHKKITEITDYYVSRRKKLKEGMKHMNNCKFAFTSLREAKNVATAISCLFPEPRSMMGPCIELLVNAVEHGNLGITFEEKSQLLLNGKWDDEIEYRQSLRENKIKKVNIDINKTNDTIYLKISDQGDGFNWEPYINLDCSRAQQVNGRGIYLAGLEFDEIEYLGRGNEVICKKMLY
jgi:CheY-like chemotaxis protein